MSKQTLLLVDGDARSLRVLEVSLRKAGFSVTTAENVRDAMEKLVVRAPELIISEIRFDDGDGFDLRRKVRAHEDWQDIPFVFLTSETAIEYKIKGLELGVDDYLTKPIYIKEIVARIGILLQKKQRSRIEERKDVRTRFVGRLADMPVVDVIQTIEVSRKSGVIQFVGERDQQAAIYFRDGKVIDAEAGALQGEDAVYRLLTWSDGDFEVMFRTVRRREVVTVSSQGLLMEGMRRLDEWTLLLEQLPSLRAKFEVDTDELVARLGEMPDGNNRILRLIDGKRSLIEIIDACDIGDLECLQVIARLYFEGLLLDVSASDDVAAPKRSGRIRAVSGPIEDYGRASPSGQMDAQPQPPSAVEPLELAAQTTLESFGTQTTPTPFAAQPTPVGFAPQVTPAPFAHQTTPIMTGGQHEQAVLLAKLAAAALAPMTSVVAVTSVVPVTTAAAEPGPLLGGLRNSSLRLIDEAVAAAEAIDPGFAIDDADAQKWWSTQPPLSTANQAPVEADAGAPATTDHATVAGTVTSSVVSGSATGSVASPVAASPNAPVVSETPSLARIALVKAAPRAGAGERLAAGASGTAPVAGRAQGAELVDGVPAEVVDSTEDITAPQPAFESVIAPVSQTSRTDSSAMRMISSLGKETAQVAGEVTKTAAAGGSEKDGTARQMVTILPRRITREIPESAVEELSKTAALANSGVAVAVAAAKQPNVELPVAASTVNIPGGTTRKRRNGPMIAGLVGLTGILLAGVVYVKCRKPSSATAPGAPAGSKVGHVVGRVDAGIDANVPQSVDAVAVPIAASTVDASTVDAVTATPPPDAAVSKKYRDLLAKAKAALDEGDAQSALRFAMESIQDKATSKAYITKADALRRLARTEEALTAITSALRMANDFAPAWEMKGRILWGAKRTGEATAAFERFLQLEPDGERADGVRALLGK